MFYVYHNNVDIKITLHIDQTPNVYTYLCLCNLQ